MKTMITGRVTEFCKSDIICVIMELSDNFTVRAQKCRSDLITIGVAENDDFAACNNIFQTGHLMSRNFVM